MGKKTGILRQAQDDVIVVHNLLLIANAPDNALPDKRYSPRINTWKVVEVSG